MTPEPSTALPALHDRVLVPDGRIGVVVGFYRSAVETVLVRFAEGEEQKYIGEDLLPADH